MYIIEVKSTCLVRTILFYQNILSTLRGVFVVCVLCVVGVYMCICVFVDCILV